MKKRNRKSFGQTINWQPTSIHVKESLDSEESHYWNWVKSHSPQSEEGDFIEFAQASPDLLGDYDSYDNDRSHFLDIIEEGYKKLSLREKQVFNCLRLKMGNKDIANKLKVNLSSIEAYRLRIRNKFLKLVRLDA